MHVSRCVLLIGCVFACELVGVVRAHAKPRPLITVDGSSTVYPISEAVAEEYLRTHVGVGVTVGVSGTGGGFKKLAAGEIDVVNASRPIKRVESGLVRTRNISFVELPIAYDALSIVVHRNNTWVDYLTVSELRKMWAPEAQGKVMKWSDVRATFPDIPLQLFGAGTDSGTFDYFTEAIVGMEDASRGDYTSSEDDNVLVNGIAGSVGALGFLGVAFYEANRDKLKIVPIDDECADNGEGPQLPTQDNVRKGVYQPLARPLFIYVRGEAIRRPEVVSFVEFYLDHAEALIEEVGYIPLSQSLLESVRRRWSERRLGSVYDGSRSLEQSLP